MTTLVDRYLSAVKEQLPRAQQDDVIAELSENLRAQIEDQEATLGRPLAEDEEAAILKRFGNPMVVAARYRGDSRSVSFGRQLIGPELFPTYLKVLTVNVVITLIVIAAVLLVGGGTAWSSMYGGLVPIAIQFRSSLGSSSTRTGGSPGIRTPGTRTPSNPATPSPATAISTGSQTTSSARPRTQTVPYTTSLLDLGLNAFGIAFLRAIGVPETTGPFAPGPAWADLYVPVTALFVLGLIGPTVTLIRPTWVEFRVATRALFDLGFLVLATISLAIGQWVVMAPNQTPTEELVGLVDAINLGVRIGVAATIVFTAMSFVLELRRLRQLRKRATCELTPRPARASPDTACLALTCRGPGVRVAAGPRRIPGVSPRPSPPCGELMPRSARAAAHREERHGSVGSTVARLAHAPDAADGERRHRGHLGTGGGTAVELAPRHQPRHDHDPQAPAAHGPGAPVVGRSGAVLSPAHRAPRRPPRLGDRGQQDRPPRGSTG